MIRVVSFSLWGNQPRYTIGAIRNAQMAKMLYPEFECWFYIHKDTVPEIIINELKKYDNVKIILKEGDLNSCKPMMWRFEAIDEPNVEVMLSRDTDTRIWEREVLAVREWLKSDKIFHIMRDHPHHGFKILGGMFLTKKNPDIPSWKRLIDMCIQLYHRDYDQNFLKEIIYPKIENNCLIHATFHQFENHCKSFPIEYNQNYNFVGEYVYEDESRNQQNIDELKRGYI